MKKKAVKKKKAATRTAKKATKKTAGKTGSRKKTAAKPKKKTTAKSKTAAKKKTTAKSVTVKRATAKKTASNKKTAPKKTTAKRAGAPPRKTAPKVEKVQAPVVPIRETAPAPVAAVPIETPAAPPSPVEQPIGIVTHYYSHLAVAVVQLNEGPLRVGETIHIKGHTTDLRQEVESMEVEHQSVQEASAGQIFGLKVRDHVREHDRVYRG